MGEVDNRFCDVVDVLARSARPPGIASFFKALRRSPAPFDATVEPSGSRSWKQIDFLIRGRRGVILEAHRPKSSEFKGRIKELMNQAAQGKPRKARSRVIQHLGGTRLIYRLKVREWVRDDDDWTFIFMLGMYLCERGKALLHNPEEGFVLPGEGHLLRP